eukprot:COSAG06_NODE_1871_length_8166_cov_129.883228_9_plen_51_part_00
MRTVDASPRLADIHKLVSAGDTGHTTVALGDVDRALRVLVVLNKKTPLYF